MDKELLEQLYRTHSGPAHLYCLSLCGDPHLSSDIVSEAFVKACLSLPEDVPSFRYWLLRVCKNLYFDHLRKTKLETGPEALDHISNGRTPETDYIEKEEYRCLWHIIASLPPGDRELLTLHYFTGLPLQEIAPILGKSYAAVRQRMVRLRKFIKQEMEDQGYGRNA